MRFKNTTQLAAPRPFGGVALGLSSERTSINNGKAWRGAKGASIMGAAFAVLLGALPLQSAHADLLVHFAFDEASGTAADNTGTLGNANDGTLLNQAAFTSAGFLGGGLSLSGSGYVTAGLSPIAGTTARTVSVWVQTTKTTGSSTLVSFGVNNTAGGGGGKWDVDINNLGGGKVEVGASNGRTTGSGTSVNDGEWHLVTTVLPTGVAANLNQVLIYVDGIYQYTGAKDRTVSTVGDATSFLRIGNFVNGTGSQYVLGTLDDVAIWNTGFTATQVAALFSLGNVAALDAGEVNQLLASFNGLHTDVTIDSTTWTYQASGIGGADGATLNLGGGSYSVNLGGGAGFITTVPEPSTVAMLFGGAAFTLGARRLRRSRSH